MKTAHPVQLAIVLPCYNEQENLPQTHRELGKVMSQMAMSGQITADSTIWFIDDGSTDDSWHVIKSQSEIDPRVRALRLSRNYGHQNAILTGMLAAKGDAVITMDADLQDDPKAIGQMIERFQSGKEIVFGVRHDRSVDPKWKRLSATAYYWLLRHIGVKLVPGHADFRLVGRRALEALRRHPESSLFLRGLISEVGFETDQVQYVLRARTNGHSKYTLRKMIGLSLNGITSFSAVPLRIISGLGLVIFAISLGLVAYGLVAKLVLQEAVPGWASITVPLYALGGLQLLGMGVLGEYVAKVFMETKRRPHAIVADQIDPKFATNKVAMRFVGARTLLSNAHDI